MKKLQDSGDLSSDETAAILVNQFTDVHLSHVEDHLTDDTDIDSDTLNEVIERVRSSYAVDAQDHAAKARHATEQQVKLRSRIHQQADKLAATITRVALWTVAMAVIALLLFSLLDSAGAAHGIALTLLLFLNALSLLFGFYVFKYRMSIQDRLAAWIRQWLTGAP